MDGDSTDRTPRGYFLFGLAVLGLLIGVWGIFLALAPLALTGAIVLLASVLGFRRRV
jgi:hypothetical protein